MRRGCLVFLSVLLILGVLIISVGLFLINRQVGLFGAPAISHQSIASPDIRFRAVLKPDYLGTVLTPFLSGISLPSWVPLDPASTLALLLPHEIALLSNSNFHEERIDITLFVNERRGGPFFLRLLRDANIDIDLKGFAWMEDRFTQPRRGVLLGHAELSIPDGVEFALLERWSHIPPDTTLDLPENHLLAAVLDNRNGELLTLMYTFIEALDGDWQSAMDDPWMETFLEILIYIYELHLHSDLAGTDTIEMQLLVKADAMIERDLIFLSNMVLLPMISNYLQNNFGLSYTGEAVWDSQEETLIINIRVDGIEHWLQLLANEVIPD